MQVSDMVLQGKDSWLFLKNDSNDVIKQITGNYDLGDEFLCKWKNVLTLRKSYFEARNIKYHYLCIPNKECVKKDFLPDGISLSDKRPFLLLENVFNNILKEGWSYPIQELASGQYPSFPKGDTHWNQYGAYLSYKKMMTNMDVDNIIDDDSIEFLTTQRVGDLISKLETGAKEEFITCKFNIPSSIKIEYDNGVSNTGRLIVINNPLALNNATLVFFRDSFGSALIHFLARTFSRVIAVWQPNIDWGILEKEAPQYVISQQVERFTISPPDDISGKTNNMIAKSKNTNTQVYYNGIF